VVKTETKFNPETIVLASLFRETVHYKAANEGKILWITAARTA
jgi:hypothetical protein